MSITDQPALPYDVRVLHEAARQLEAAARQLRAIQPDTLLHVADVRISDARTLIHAAMARIPE